MNALHQGPSSGVRVTQDPFRLFFPFGVLLGILGVLLWPIHFAGWLAAYPALLHSRLMIEGFMAAFVIGFLTTAGPRLVSSRPLSPAEIGVLLFLQISVIAANFGGFFATGDLLFFLLLTSFAVVLGRRFLGSNELPPPNFVLVGLGIASGWAGSAMLLLAHFNAVFAPLYLLGTHLVNEAFILLPLLGVGVFLFPRFLGTQPASGAMLDAWSPLWAGKAKLAAITAVLVISSYVVELYILPIAGGLLRATAATAYLMTQAPALFRLNRVPILGWCVRVGVWSMLIGLAAMGIFPAHRVAGLHTVVIGGYSLITFTVGTRVILGHSGQSHLFATKLPFLIWTASLLLLCLVTRVIADLVPAVRNSHLIYAAIIWFIAAGIWSWRLLPSIGRPDSE